MLDGKAAFGSDVLTYCLTALYHTCALFSVHLDYWRSLNLCLCFVPGFGLVGLEDIKFVIVVIVGRHDIAEAWIQKLGQTRDRRRVTW